MPGIAKVMQYVGNSPPEVIGQKVASALVGTFLGILLASVRGYPPVAIEFARKQLFFNLRPSFSDLENELKGAK